MYGGVAISTAVGKELFLSGSQYPLMTRVMALDTEKGHGGRQQSTINRPMRNVAIYAVFGYIAMLVDKRPALFHVTATA